MLLSKYNQQYYKLFKDIPLEVVLKGELPPWDVGQAICVPEAQGLSETSRHKFMHEELAAL